MSKRNLRPAFLTCLLISWLFTPAEAGKKEHLPFVFNCERYEEGVNHFDGTKYLSVSFLVKTQQRHGEQTYTAKLKKAVVSRSHSSGRKTSAYYESGDPVNTTTPGYVELAVRFLERHPVVFKFRAGQLVLENGDSLKKAFDQEVKIFYPGTLIRPLGYNDEFFRFDLFLHIFGNIRQDLPDDLKTPGDLSLRNGVVYSYLNACNTLQQVEITDPGNHTRSMVYVRSGSNRIKYKKEQSLRIQTITRAVETGERSICITGFMPNDKNKKISFAIEAMSPLVPAQKIVVNADSTGKFNILLDQDFPVILTSTSGYRFYAEPGDDFQVSANKKGDSLFFAGIGAENNRFIQEEARVEKFPKMDYRSRTNQTRDAWFRKADQSTNTCVALLEIYQNDLTPRFYESQYLNYYFGKINRKLDYLFGYVELNQQGIRKRKYTGLDTIPSQYQSFVYNREFNKFLENNFILQFEKLRDFTYATNFQSNEIPTQPDMLRLAALSYSGKILRDYFEFVTPRIDRSGKAGDKTVLKNLIQENFDNTTFQTRVLQLLEKASLLETGSVFPDIRFKDSAGKNISLTQFRGKLLYLMFWRNDALTLDRQWDEYQQLTKTLNAENVLVVCIGMEESFDKWKTYMEAMPVNGMNLFVDRKSNAFRTNFSRLKSRHFMLIDRTGTIVNNNGPDPSVANLLISQNLGSSGNEKRLTVALFFFLAILFILGLMWIISRTRRMRKAKIETLLNRLRETELKAIKAQMNPHFLFNSLNSIQNLINQQKIEAANMYLSKFARLLHAVLQHSEKEFVPLAAELETLDLYVQLEKLRFNFEYQLHLDTAIDIHNSYIPPLLMQPFIENAILHGLQPKQGEKKLCINIEENDKQLVCTIEDNGIGRNLSQNGKIGHHGMGNKLSIERIQLLNQKNDSNFKLSIRDGEAGTAGTRVTISFTNNLI